MSLLSLAFAVGSCFADAAEPVKPIGVIGEAGGTGEYPAIAESAADMRQNTIYRPLNLKSLHLPVVLWGNGGCRDNGLNHAGFLRELASHGFFVVAAGYPRAARGVERPRPSTSGSPVRAPTRFRNPTGPQQLIDAIDWAERHSRDPDSPYYERIDTSRVAVMGHSCGGLITMKVAADPRIDTAVLFNSGILNEPLVDVAESPVLGMEKAELDKLHTPIAYINGGESDVAYPNALDDFERISTVPVLFAANDVGHSGTFWLDENGGEYAQLATAWLSWQLKGDALAASWFIGPRCTLCEKPNWQVKQKGF